MQKQKIEKGSEAYQAGRDLIINQGSSLEEISGLVKNLLELNAPSIIYQAKEEALEYVKEFNKRFLSELKDELDINKIQESLKKPHSQFLLKEGMENAARYGNSCDLTLLIKAIQKAMLEDNQEKVLLATSASNIIPQLSKSQLSLLSVLYFISMIGLGEESFTFPPIVSLELFSRKIIYDSKINVIGQASKFHLITLGVCSYNEYAAESAESFLKRRYPKTFESKILPMLTDEYEEPKTLKFAIEYFNNHKLSQFSLTPVGSAIGFLIVKANGTLINENLFGQY